MAVGQTPTGGGFGTNYLRRATNLPNHDLCTVCGYYYHSANGDTNGSGIASLTDNNGKSTLWIDSGNVLNFYNGGNFGSSYTLTVGKWYFWAYVLNGTAGAVYFAPLGVAIASTPTISLTQATGLTTTAAVLLQDSGGTGQGVGYLAYVRSWNAALTVAELNIERTSLAAVKASPVSDDTLDSALNLGSWTLNGALTNLGQPVLAPLVSVLAGPWGTANDYPTTTNATAIVTTTVPSKLVVMVAVRGHSAVTIPSVTSVAGSGLTFTKASTGTGFSDGTLFGYTCEIWTALATASLSSVTLTVTTSEGADKAVTVIAVSPSASIGQVLAQTTFAGSNLSVPFTGLTSGSMILASAWTNAIFNNGNAVAGTTIIDNQNGAGLFLRNTTSSIASSANLSSSNINWTGGYYTGAELKITSSIASMLSGFPVTSSWVDAPAWQSGTSSFFSTSVPVSTLVAVAELGSLTWEVTPMTMSWLGGTPAGATAWTKTVDTMNFGSFAGFVGGGIWTSRATAPLSNAKVVFNKNPTYGADQIAGVLSIYAFNGSCSFGGQDSNYYYPSATLTSSASGSYVIGLWGTGGSVAAMTLLGTTVRDISGTSNAATTNAQIGHTIALTTASNQLVSIGSSSPLGADIAAALEIMGVGPFVGSSYDHGLILRSTGTLVPNAPTVRLWFSYDGQKHGPVLSTPLSLLTSVYANGATGFPNLTGSAAGPGLWVVLNPTNSWPAISCSSPNLNWKRVDQANGAFAFTVWAAQATSSLTNEIVALSHPSGTGYSAVGLYFIPRATMGVYNTGYSAYLSSYVNLQSSGGIVLWTVATNPPDTTGSAYPDHVLDTSGTDGSGGSSYFFGHSTATFFVSGTNTHAGLEGVPSAAARALGVEFNVLPAMGVGGIQIDTENVVWAPIGLGTVSGSITTSKPNELIIVNVPHSVGQVFTVTGTTGPTSLAFEKVAGVRQPGLWDCQVWAAWAATVGTYSLNIDWNNYADREFFSISALTGVKDGSADVLNCFGQQWTSEGLELYQPISATLTNTATGSYVFAGFSDWTSSAQRALISGTTYRIAGATTDGDDGAGDCYMMYRSPGPVPGGSYTIGTVGPDGRAGGLAIEVLSQSALLLPDFPVTASVNPGIVSLTSSLFSTQVPRSSLYAVIAMGGYSAASAYTVYWSGSTPAGASAWTKILTASLQGTYPGQMYAAIWKASADQTLSGACVYADQTSSSNINGAGVLAVYGFYNSAGTGSFYVHEGDDNAAIVSATLTSQAANSYVIGVWGDGITTGPYTHLSGTIVDVAANDQGGSNSRIETGHFTTQTTAAGQVISIGASDSKQYSITALAVEIKTT